MPNPDNAADDALDYIKAHVEFAREHLDLDEYRRFLDDVDEAVRLKKLFAEEDWNGSQRNKERA